MNIPAIVVGKALIALMLMTFADVILRSIFNAPIQAGADLTRLLMAVTLAIYIVLGCVFESLSMLLLLLLTVFFPLVVELGFDPVWFGIIVVVVVEISLITTPVGLNVFVLKSVVGDVFTVTIFKGVTPFWIVDTIRLLILLFIPGLVLFLPGHM